MGILENKIEIITRDYNNTKERLANIIKTFPKYKEVIKRLLLTDDIWGVFGYKVNGNYSWVSSMPYEKISFVKFFVSHELLDDGIPTVRWCKYNGKEGKWEVCDRTVIGAYPYISQISEGDEKLANKDDVLFVIDFLEEKRRSFTTLQDGDKWEDEPAYKLLLDFANEIGC